MNKRQEGRRDQPAFDLAGIVVGLRVIAVNLGNSVRLNILAQESLGITDGEAQILQAALVAAARGIADDYGQDVDAEVIVVRSPDGAVNQVAPVATAQVEDERRCVAEKFSPVELACRR